MQIRAWLIFWVTVSVAASTVVVDYFHTGRFDRHDLAISAGVALLGSTLLFSMFRIGADKRDQRFL